MLTQSVIEVARKIVCALSPNKRSEAFEYMYLSEKLPLSNTT